MRSVRPSHLQPLSGGMPLAPRGEGQEAPGQPGVPARAEGGQRNSRPPASLAPGLARRLRRASGMGAVLGTLAGSAAGAAPGEVAVALAFDPHVRAWRCAVAGPVPSHEGWIDHLQGTHPIRPDVIHLARRAGLRPLGVEIEAPEGPEGPIEDGEARSPAGLLAVLRRAQGEAAPPGGEAPHSAAPGPSSAPAEALHGALGEIAAVGALALRGAHAEALVAALEGEREEQQQFLSIAAHDLRTPLAAIRGYAQLLQRQAGPGAPAGQRNGLQTIVQQTDRLADLTEVVLDVARIQTRRLALQRVTADLGQVVREAARGLQMAPTGPALVLRLPEALPRVQGDLARLSQIARALLEFALARTPEGKEVMVEVRPDAGDEAGPKGAGGEPDERGEGVILLVQDKGPALPEGERKGLFSRLVRPAAEGMSATLGALRLFIARGAAEAHGGRAWVESPALPTEGGVRLAVWLPVAGAPGAGGGASPED